MVVIKVPKFASLFSNMFSKNNEYYSFLDSFMNRSIKVRNANTYVYVGSDAFACLYKGSLT